LRELGRDVSQGRLFIPLDVLERHGASLADMAAGRATIGIKAAVAELAALGRIHFGEATRLMRNAPPPARPALLPLALVPLYLNRVERAEDPFRSDNSVPQWRRQWRLWRAARALPQRPR
jgi:phytoene synthase